MATVSLPDGTEIEFPDSMSGEEIRKALDRKFRPQTVAPKAPQRPQQFDWDQPPIGYGSRRYTAADLLASNVPITQEQYLQGQKTVGSVAEMKELERRKLVPGNPNLPQDMQLQNVRDFYEKQGPGWTPYLTERVPFSPVGMIRNVQLGGLSLPGLGQVYEGAYQRYQEGRATAEDMHYIAEAEMEAKRNSEKGIIGKATDIVTQAPGLAMEVVVSGGGSAVARGAAKKMVQKYGLKAAAPLAKRVAGAALKTAAATPFRTIEEASQRQQNGEAPAQSLLNAFTGQVIDRATELLGSVVPAPKRLEAISDWAKNAWIAKTGLDPTAFKERLARVGINGVLGELAEERVAEIGRGIVTGDDFGVTGQVADGQFQEAGRQLLSEIIASAAMQGGGSVAGMAEQIGKNKGKKPVAEALPPVEDAYPDPGRPEATVDALIEEQNKGKKRDETFRAEVDRQFNPPRVEDVKRQDFKALEPEAYFREYEGSREALAALPDSPSRGQFAKALGIPTSAIRRDQINTFVAAAKRAPQQVAAPVQEPTLPDTSPAEPPPPVQEAAPVEQEAPKPEAWQRVYEQLPEDMNSLAVLASSFGIKLPKKGTKAHSALKAEDLRVQVADAMTVRPQGKFQEIKPEPKPLVTARDVQQPPVDVAEFEDVPYKSPGPYEEPGGKWVPLKKKGKASSPLAKFIKNKGKEPTFKLENKPEWKGDRPLEDTREAKKQGVFISGLGKDLPGQQLLVDTDFEGEVKQQKSAPAGWGSVDTGEAPPDIKYEESKVKTSPGGQRIIEFLRKSGRGAIAVEPRTDLHRDMEKLTREFGLDVAFFQSKDRVAGVTNANTVAFNVRSADEMSENYTWGIVGHEIAHGTGVDQLIDAFGKDLVEEWSKKYYDNVSPDIKKRLDVNKDLYQREGVASLIENFMRDPKFRTKLKQSNVTAWGKVVDKVWDVFSGFTPESKSMKTALEVLKRARNTEIYHENKIREIATDTVRQHGPESNQEQMIEDFAKLIKDKHREAVSAFKLREKVKSEAKVKLGLDARKAASIEDRGKDLSSVKNIDTVGRSLVNEYQDLFPGDAEQQDYERIAWDLVSEPRFDKPPELSQSMIDEAWEQLTGGQDMRGDAWEPDEEQKTLWEDSGFDLFAEEPEKVGVPTKLRNEDVQRAFGRANPATTLAGRMEIMREDFENNAPLRVPRAVAEAQAAARLSGDGAAKERNAFLEKFKKNDFTPLNEADTVVLRKILDMTSIASVITRGEQAIKDHALLQTGYRLSRSEQARALGLRDPLFSQKGLTREVRNNRALTDIMEGIDPALIQELIDLLKRNGLDISTKDILSNDEAIMKALGVIKAWRHRQDNKWKHASDMVYEFYLNAILSGPQTHIANTIGNAFNSFWINAVERTVEVAVSKATLGKLSNDSEVRDFRELVEMWKAMGPAIGIGLRHAKIAWRTEFSPLNLYTGDPGGVMSVLAPSYSIPSVEVSIPRYKKIMVPVGGFIRSFGFRPLAAADEFARTINAHGSAAIHAYRLGKKNGVEPEKMAEYVAKHVGDYTSPVWHDAMHEAAYAAFQQDGGEISRTIKGSVNLLKKIPGIRYQFPFSSFIVNSFGRMADMTPVLGVAVGLVNRNDKNNLPNWNRVAADQLIGLAVLAAVGAWVDDEDEDGLPRITGTKAKNLSQRSHEYDTAPPMSILINGKYYSYGRIEPLNSMLATTVDFLKRNKAGEPASTAAVKSFFSQIKEKNYAQGIDDIIRVRDGEMEVEDIPANTVIGFVPNIYRQAVRESRNIVTDSRFQVGEGASQKLKKMGVKAEIPFVSTAYRYDAWGRPMRTNALSTSYPYRIFSPFKVKDTKEILPVNLAIMRYNETAEKPYYPSLPDRDVKYNGKHVSPEDFAEYAREAGEIAYSYIKDYKFNDPPTDGEIEYIKRIREVGRKQAKANLMERLSRRNGK